MIRFAYCCFNQGTIYGLGDEIVVVRDSLRNCDGVEQICGAFDTRGEKHYVKRSVEYVTEWELSQMRTNIDAELIRRWLSEPVLPVWMLEPIMVRAGLDFDPPGWFEIEGVDQLFDILRELMASLRYIRPWQHYVDSMKDNIEYAVAGDLQLLPVERLFGPPPTLQEPLL